MARMYKCDTVRAFVAKTGFPDRTLSRVVNSQPVSMSTLIRLEGMFEWQPGTALRHLQSGKPELTSENEAELWEALEKITVLTPRDRAAFLDLFRRHREDNKSDDERSG